MPPRRPAKRSQRWSDDRWPPPSTPIAVEGGLQAHSPRGRIGDTWWSQRFITELESVGLGSRLQRGKRYARTGQVLSLDVAPGQVTASVQGSRTKPYEVFIEIRVLTAVEWDAAEAVMASSASFMATLLAGDMPDEIEEAFAESSGTLFPASADGFDSTCSCPDWENPCKHVAAVYFLLAEAFDRDPFLIFSWRGRDKDELLAGLRARRRGLGSAHEAGRSDPTEAPRVPDGGQFGWPVADPDRAAAPQETTPPWSWGRDEDLATIEIRPRLAVAPDLVLRQLDPSPLSDAGALITEALRPLYEAITGGAAALVLGEPAPVHVNQETGPGHTRTPS
jgi:uncharacterized Zn finger protein